MARYPDTFIIGAPKSGTTSLYEYLKGHPDVFMPAVKEPTYFAPDLPPNTSEHMLRFGPDHDVYLELFAGAGEARRIGEASVRYMSSRVAPGLIRDFQPRPFIVAALRNPVDMVHSLHAHRVAGGTEDLIDLEAALEAEEDRRAGRRIPPNSNAARSVYTDRARYGEQLERWFNAFGPERIHVIIFEEMVRQPAESFHRLLEFLGVDPNYQPPDFRAHNPRHATRSRLLRSLLHSRPPQWLVWTLMPRVLGEQRTRSLVRSFRHSRLHRRPARHLAMPEHVRRRLESEFAPDVVRLSRLLGRDMGQAWWGRSVPGQAPRHE